MKRAPALAVLALLVPLATCRDAIAPAQPAIGLRSVDAPPAAVSSATWTGLPSMLVAPGQPKVATGRDGRVYMFDAGSSAEVFDPPTFTWHAISPDPTTGDYFSLNGSAVASGGDGRIYIAGGRDCASCASTKVRAYDPGTDTYVGVASMHVGRVRAAAATGRDGKVYMFGGDDGNFSLASAEVYDPQLNSWLVIASTLVARSGAAAATASDGRIFLIGGSVFDQGGHGLASSVEAYSPTTNTWSFVASLPAGRFGHSASTGADGWIYVTGGSDDSRPTASVLSYNPVRDLWTTEASLSVVRHNLGGTSGLDGNIYAIGGQDASGQALRSVEWLQTAPDTVFAALTRTGSGQSSYGEEKAFTVKLRSHTGLLPNDGESIDLVAGSTVVGSALLKAGSAIFRIALPVGKYVIHAEYAGNAELPSAISNTSSLQVRKSQTKATLSVTPNPSIFGQDVISRVTIAAVAPGVSTPTGFVTFSIFNPLVGITYETKVAIQDGTANLPIVSDLVVDGHQLIVFYEGDVNYETSGTEVILHVNAPANSAPIANAGGPYGGNEGATITFNAVASSDPDGDPLTYDWNFGDGTVANNAGATPSHAYADNGPFTVTVTVRDALHASVASASVGVGNVSPTVSAIAGAQIIQGGTYSATGSFTDPGADTFNGSVNYGDGSSAAIATGGNAFTLGHTYAVAGTFEVTVSITDDDGGTGSASAFVTVINSPPVAVVGGPYAGNEGSSIAFNASGSADPDGDPLTYDWNFGDGTVEPNSGPTPAHAYADNGTFNATVTVHDDHGHASTAIATVTVANVAPSVSTIANAQILQGESYSFNGSFTDPGADTHEGSVNWGDNSSAPLGLNGKNFSLSHVYASAGTFTVTVSITDDDGGTGTTSALVTVINSPPVAAAGGPYAGNEGSSIAFNASGSADPDGDPLTYDWNFGDGTVEPNSGPTPAHAYADNGAFNATVTVHDDHGHASTAIVTVTVANVAPSVSTIAGAQILQGGTYSAAGSFTDPGADTFTGSVNYGDGSSAAIATGGNAFTVGHTYAVAGTFTVTVSITDDDGGAGTSSATVTVLSPAGATQVLAGTVQTLLTSGAITGQTASQLTTSLNSAVASLAAGKTTAATGQLGSFINKVQAGMNSGKISAANGAALIAFAQQVLNSI